ncbi:hypothetical protein PFICI_11884 [Pestalotiopsis fici W106-1]|uniref:Nephrocystin 3-like N-terminal domain-containing protein n=1 Tax=Pestalotiopsis fici (strain W106-1 / CGMCC3.15140) TaxID=1229662 RepID=W3WTK4_PESFW|nr:uncharacterized protein PFICI_11884 [Pestalotiopsis fici W106-1]ETS76497.1 hypothetical protein PFICI_11884 [Pestalotiopsis fici W106-1]
MEVIGLIAGLPGLIEIIQKTAEIASQLKNWKSLAGEMNTLLQQLEGLENTLKDVQVRGTYPSLSPSQVANFQANLDKIRVDLTNLNKLLTHCNTSAQKGGMRFMRQVKLLLTGFDKTTKKHIERIRDTRAELTLAIVGQVHQGLSQSTSKTDLLLQLEKTLSPSSRDFIPPKLNTTCDWIWSDKHLNTWVDSFQHDPSDQFQRLFCLYGPKGCGKSVLSASIADTLRDKGKISTFFSYWAGSESQRKFNGLLKTILWQLLKYLSADNVSQVASILMGASSSDERPLRAAMDFTVRMIESKVYMIIDGIDEAEKDWNDPEDQSLLTIHDLLQTHTNIHILLCGRETSLSRAITSSPSSLKISQDFLRDDINALIEWHLDSSSKSHVKLSKDLVRESLHAKSGMMFLWVNLVFKELNRSLSTSSMRVILSNTPPTLDEEYNRMFDSLMKRSAGSSTRPSVTMKTVKRIFSLILAAPEPLTLAELSYACAAEMAIPSAHDYELLTREGLVDSCGDFINESNGHFHFAHASIEEFLTRPVDQWSRADSNVLYFQIDRMDSQKSMIESCFNYISSMEMGYPIHDKSMHSLPESYPFFHYASRFLPVLLANAMSVITNSALEDFIASKQFCGLVEYVVHTLEMDSWDLFLQYLDLLHSLSDFRIPISTLMAAIKVELGQREKELGEHDPRYQTWASIVGMLSAYLDCSITEYAQQDASITHASGLAAEPSTQVTALTVHFTAQNHGAILAQLRPNISALLQFRLLESLRSVPVAILPTWVIILWALQTWNGQNENSPRARPMLETALRRVRKRRNFTESVCLLYLAIMEDHNTQLRHEVDKCSLFSWFRESLEIAQDLPSSPQVEAVIQRALCGVTEALLLHNDRENAMFYSRQLEESVCSNDMVNDDAGWLKRMFYRGSAWAKWKVLVLGIHTTTLSGHNINKDAGRMNQFVLDLHTERNWHRSPAILEWHWSKSLILWRSGKIDECRISLRLILEHLNGLEGTRHHAEYWPDTAALLTQCLLREGKEAEALEWLLKAPIAHMLQKPVQVQSLGITLLKLGCIDRALEAYNCWGREKLLQDLRQLEWTWLLLDVERLLARGIDAKDELRTSALYDAASGAHSFLVESLLARGARVDFRHDLSWDTPLTIATKREHHSTVEVLLDQGADHDHQNADGKTPWYYALTGGKPFMVGAFLKAGVDVDRHLPTGWTPLTLAAYNGHDSVVKLLLDHGADKRRRDLCGLTPLAWAEQVGHSSVVQVLNHGDQVDSKGSSPSFSGSHMDWTLF